jgi:predicted DsbA family dithiol-disulfide isomerase
VVQIEVWSDVVCPWCFIGKRRLEAALAACDGLTNVDIVHRAFQLDPHANTAGEATVAHLAAKYNVSAEDAASMMANVTDVAAQMGLTYDLLHTQVGNTELAHELLLWAQEQGAAAALLEALYTAYFEQAEPVFTPEQLLPIVVRAGLNPQEASEVLSDRRYRQQVRDDQALAAQFGANGVPFFVIDRAFGVSGAQPVDVFISALTQAQQAGA